MDKHTTCKWGHSYVKKNPRYNCPECSKIRTKKSLENDPDRMIKYRQENREKARKYGKEHYQNNKKDYLDRSCKQRINSPELSKSYQKEYRAKNLKVLKLKSRERSREYIKNNPGKHAARQAIRRVKKLQATPIWLNDDQRLETESYYVIAKIITEITGEKWHVDHIIPLQGKNVSGLHVPWNLQLLPATENLSKGNRLDLR